MKQDKDEFPTLFQNNVAKRPDFLVLIDSIGMIAVDVKNYKLSKDKCYTLKLETEVLPALNFERLFRIPVWYAYYDEKDENWYWISALKAISKDLGEKRENQDSGEYFLAIKRKEFVKIGENDDLGKLYTLRVGNGEFDLNVLAGNKS
ncbi:MAG: hypothetical protein R8G66_06020 [Cytophagales bacterium]|nr:hypothetical protein [Cytophagales bacterium]